MFIIQRDSSNTFLSPEQSAAYSIALKRNIPILSEALPGTLTAEQFANATAVVGSVAYLSYVLSTLGCAVPASDYYPRSLRPWLRRRVWQGSSASALRVIRELGPLFIKSHAYKQLTGTVLQSEDAWPAELSTPDLAVWISEPVVWRAEYRVYVIDGAIRSVCRYDDGDTLLTLDMAEVAKALNALKSQSGALTCAVDFGVLKSGETALVECNDAWAIGRYAGCDDTVYMEMLTRRWAQMTASRVV